jgi:REP element-mobilizing transposase RayT
MSTRNPRFHRPFDNALGRRSIRLPEYDYSRGGAYYITICTQYRKCLFGKIRNGKIALSEYGRIIDNWWQRIPERYGVVALDEYVIMPNHMHAIIVVGGDVYNGVGAIHELPLRIKRRVMILPKIIGYFKMNSAKQINQICNTTGQTVWQRNYWEHVIRNDKSLNKIREYIRDNPWHWAADDENPERVTAVISRGNS